VALFALWAWRHTRPLSPAERAIMRLVFVALAFAACGLAVLYALWFCIVTLSFWLVDVGNLDRLFYGIFEAARYPVGFFRGAMRALLTFVVPIAFATTFPAQAVLGTADLRMLLYGVVSALAALTLAHFLWRHAIRSSLCQHPCID